MRINREQTISSERVMTQMQNSFITETGKVIPGKWPEGEMAPIIFDNRYKCYLAVFKEDKAGAPEKRVDEMVPAVGKQKLSITRPVMVTFDSGEKKIFFRMGKKSTRDSVRSFYIDIQPALASMEHDDGLNTFYFLSVVEYRPYIGVLFYSRDYGNDWYVIRFMVASALSNLYIYNSLPYKEYAFTWLFDMFNMDQETINDLIPIPTCSLGVPGRPLGTADIWFQKTRNGWDQAQAIGVQSTWGGYDIHGPDLGEEGNYSDLYWTLNIYADHLERAGIQHNGTGAQAAVRPVGASVWLTKIDGGLDDIKWGIHFSGIAGYAFYARSEGGHKNEYESEGTWNVSDPYKHDNFNVPFMLYMQRDNYLQLNDPFNVFGVPWAAEVGGPMFEVGYGPQNFQESEVDPGNPSVNHDDPMIQGFPIYRKDNWPGNCRHSHLVLNSSGLFNKHILHKAYQHYSDPGVLLGESHFIDSSLIANIDMDYALMPGFRPPGFYYDSDLYEFTQNTRPNGRFCRHVGGGIPNRVMLRVAPMSMYLEGYTEAAGKDRSVYLVDGVVYDYDHAVSLPFGFGRVSKELLATMSILSMEKLAVLDSNIDVYGNATLTGKLNGFLDLVGIDGGEILSDFGMLPSSFWKS